ncbi:MAG TPA: hypothetical protein VJN96_13275 [Vicinamibacterales bacterium]|nr:hypothetical protein [Vicinamibacterales bacterium]
MRETIAALAAVYGCVLVAATPQPSAFPRGLDTYLTTSVRLTPPERQSLLAGTAVTKMLDTDPAREVAVFGAVWIKASPDDYVRAVTDIEQLERGESFLATKKISEPPKLEDFAAMELPQEDIDDLRACKVSACQVKISQEGLDRLRRGVDWSKPTARADVNKLMRQAAFDYVTAYRTGGNAQLAVYRDQEHPTFVAKEFESMVNRMPEFTVHLPELRKYLLEYPSITLPDSTSFFYWQTVVFGLKPTTRINHVVIAKSAEGTAVVTKQLYASHYFWTALELRTLVPDPARGPGFWFVNVNRSRSDGLSGFVGRLIRGKVRSGSEDGMKAALKITKQRLEAR